MKLNRQNVIQHPVVFAHVVVGSGVERGGQQRDAEVSLLELLLSSHGPPSSGSIIKGPNLLHHHHHHHNRWGAKQRHCGITQQGAHIERKEGFLESLLEIPGFV